MNSLRDLISNDRFLAHIAAFIWAANRSGLHPKDKGRLKAAVTVANEEGVSGNEDLARGVRDYIEDIEGFSPSIADEVYKSLVGGVASVPPNVDSAPRNDQEWINQMCDKANDPPLNAGL